MKNLDPKPSTTSLASQARKPERLYAHWLDGEWLKIARGMPLMPGYFLWHIAESALKLHALFGTRMVISDVQLTDSEVMLQMFIDEHFRAFLGADPGFLTVVAQPAQELKDPVLAIAARGLHRSLDPGWTTSLPGVSDVDAIRRFAEQVLRMDPFEIVNAAQDRTKGPGRVISNFPQYERYFQGILQGVGHFASRKSLAEKQSVVPRPYTMVIEDIIKGGGQSCEDLSVIWESVKQWVPEEGDRKRRSSIIKRMEEKEPDRSKWPPDWRRDLNTVVHAWNANVCDTVGASGASIVPLPFSVASCRGRVRELAGPFTEQLEGVLQPRVVGRSTLLSFDPSAWTWRQIRDAVEKTGQERENFQRALSDGDEPGAVERNRQLVQALRSSLVAPMKPVMPGWKWAILSGINPYFALFAAADKFAPPLLTAWERHIVVNTLGGFGDELIAFSTGQPHGQS